MAGRYGQKKKHRSPVGILLLLLLCAGIAVWAAFREKPAQAESIRLQLGDRILAEAADVDAVKALLTGAEDIGYVPKTYVLGPELVYTGSDGQQAALELDMDGDLFRYNGRFFDYGPGNDNNALPELLALLGLEDWPEEVKTAFPEWFASIEEGILPTDSYRQQSVYMDLWYPDWYYVKIQEDHALTILDALRDIAHTRMDRDKVPVEESIFTIHIAYNAGREYDLACVGEAEFLLWEGGTDAVYGFTDAGFRETLDKMIALSKAMAE